MKYQQDIVMMIDKIQKDKKQLKRYQNLIYSLGNEVQRFEANIVLIESLLTDLEALGVTVKIDKNKFPSLAGSNCPKHIAEALDLID